MKFYQIVLLAVFLYATVEAHHTRQDSLDDTNDVVIMLEGADEPIRRLVGINKLKNWFKKKIRPKQEDESNQQYGYGSGKGGKSVVVSVNTGDTAERLNKLINVLSLNFAVTLRALKDGMNTKD